VSKDGLAILLKKLKLGVQLGEAYSASKKPYIF
jgi:hypothetical protein